MTTQLIQHFSPTDTTKVIRVAQYLGLQPIGWMFSYSNDRTADKNNEDGGLPVWGTEIEISARLQIEYMKKYCHESSRNAITSTSEIAKTEIPRFGTLAMDARTGATEAFQISDVAVQMVAEDMFVIDKTSAHGSDRTDRYIATRHPVIVDGKPRTAVRSRLDHAYGGTGHHPRVPDVRRDPHQRASARRDVARRTGMDHLDGRHDLGDRALDAGARVRRAGERQIRAEAHRDLALDAEAHVLGGRHARGRGVLSLTFLLIFSVVSAMEKTVAGLPCVEEDLPSGGDETNLPCHSIAVWGQVQTVGSMSA